MPTQKKFTGVTYNDISASRRSPAIWIALTPEGEGTPQLVKVVSHNRFESFSYFELTVRTPRGKTIEMAGRWPHDFDDQITGIHAIS